MYKIHKKAKIEYRKECERCHSLFSFDDEEIMTCTKGSNPATLKFVDCPVCGYTMDVDNDDAYGLVDEDSISGHAGLSDFIHKITDIFKNSEDSDE